MRLFQQVLSKAQTHLHQVDHAADIFLIHAVESVVKDQDFLRHEFVELVRARGKLVVEKRQLTPALSAARAIAQHLTLLWFGTPAVSYI